MWRQDHGVARLDRDQDLEDCSRGWISGRNDPGDDTTRAGDLYNVFRFGNDSLRAKAAEVVPNIFRSKAVLLLFVSGYAKSGFLDGHRTQPRRFTQRRTSHRFTDTIDLRLVERGNLRLRSMRRLDEVTRLLYRN